jgi:hypothetical protein
MKNTYFDTTAASLFVTGETTVKIFIFLNASNRLGRCVAMDVCSDLNIQASRQHATVFF